MLFIDARHIFRQIDRAHRDFLPEQIELLANIVRLYRGEEVETVDGSAELMAELFPDGAYVDVPVSARSLRSPRSRRRAGASTPADTPGRLQSWKTARTSRCGWRSCVRVHDAADQAEALRRGRWTRRWRRGSSSA